MLLYLLLVAVSQYDVGPRLALMRITIYFQDSGTSSMQAISFPSHDHLVTPPKLHSHDSLALMTVSLPPFSGKCKSIRPEP